MRIVTTRAFSRKSTLFVTAFALVLGVLAAGVPFILSQSANAVGGTTAEVHNEAELVSAAGDTDVTTISVKASFTTSQKIVFSGRNVYIDGNGNKITFTGDASGWQGDYVIQAYKNTLGVKNLSVTGGDAAFYANGSTLNFEGTVNVSGNEFGGIEVSQGNGVSTPAVLNVGTSTLVNSTEANAKPTAWIDHASVANATVNGNFTVTTHIGADQKQYYLVAANAGIAATNTTQHTTYATLQAAVTAANAGDTVQLNGNVTLAQMLYLDKPLTLDGNGKTVTAPYSYTINSVDNAVITITSSDVTVKNLTTDNTSANAKPHGIVVQQVSNVNLQNLTLKDGRAGVIVNGSTVTASDIHTINNSWYGIDVDRAGAQLTISGNNSHADATGVPAIMVDNRTVPTSPAVIDVDNQYTITALGQSDLYYFTGKILPAPTNLTPATGSYTTDVNFNNTWTAVPGAAGYQYQTSHSLNGTDLGPIAYSDSSALQPERYDLSGSTVIRKNISTPDDVWYWQVRTVNAQGTPGPWSVISKVTLDTVKPSTSTLTAPAPVANAIETTGTFPMTWTAATDNGSGVAYYEYQAASTNAVDANGALQTVIYKSNEAGHQGPLYSPEVQASGTPDGTYYWQVRAIDNAGNVGDWSSVGKVTVDSTVATPTLVSPSDNAFVNGASVTQTWSTTDPADTDHYIYESFNDAAMTQLRFRATYTGTSKTATNIADGTVYYWHVIAVDAAGNTATSPLWKITIDNTAPTAPSNVVTTPNPTNSTTNTWTWDAATDNGAGVKGYEYRINDGDWLLVAGTTVTVTSPVENGLYTLFVRAIDNAGNTGPEASGTVLVDTTGPDVSADTYTTTGNVITPNVVATEAPASVHWAQTAGLVGGVTISDPDILTPSFTVSIDGPYTFSLTAEDSLGNSTVKLFSFNYLTPETNPSPNTTGTAADGTGTPVTATTFFAATPTIVGPGFTQAAVLGTSTDNSSSDTGVQGATTSKDTVATAVNSEANKGTFLGLGWYWWILIIAAVAAIAWWIAAAVRRRQAQN